MFHVCRTSSMTQDEVPLWPRSLSVTHTSTRQGQRLLLLLRACTLDSSSTVERRVGSHSALLFSAVMVGWKLCRQQTPSTGLRHPSTTAVFSYAIGSRKLSANEQFFAGAQTVVSLLQTTQIKQGVSFIATNKVYTSTNKTTIVWIETELFSLFFTRGGCISCLRACFGCRLLLQSY